MKPYFRYMALIDSIIVFVIGLVIGGIGIYVGGRVITGEEDYGYAIGTAFIGAIVWALVGFLFGGIPGIGPALALIAWIWIINMRYSGGWLNAGLIGAISWVTVIIVLSVLASLGIGGFEAIGVPA